MSEVSLIDERELLAMGMSRQTVAALRNLQRVVGQSISSQTNSDIYNLSNETQELLSTFVNGIRSKISSLQSEIAILREETIARKNNTSPIENRIETIENYLGL